MALWKAVLRPRKEKQKKSPAKSNAQRLAEYRARIKANPILYAEWKEKKKLDSRHRQASLTDEQKQLQREKARLRQRECRARKKVTEGKVIITPKPTKNKVKSSNSQCMTRVQAQKAAAKREANRIRQQKRRALMSTQKKRRVNERRRELYRSKRQINSASSTPKPKPKIRLDILLKGVRNTLKRSRDKLSLFKVRFLKKILARQATENSSSHESFYKRAPRNDFVVEHFLERVSVDFPGLRGSSSQKKSPHKDDG